MSTPSYNLPTIDPEQTFDFVDSVNGLAAATDAVLRSVEMDSQAQGDYVLPPAGRSLLGGVRVGDGLEIAADGTLKRPAAEYTLPAATATQLGGVKTGGGIRNKDGAIQPAPDAYSNASPLTGDVFARGSITGANLADGAVEPADVQALPQRPAALWSGAKVTSLYLNKDTLTQGENPNLPGTGFTRVEFARVYQFDNFKCIYPIWPSGIWLATPWLLTHNDQPGGSIGWATGNAFTVTDSADAKFQSTQEPWLGLQGLSIAVRAFNLKDYSAAQCNPGYNMVVATFGDNANSELTVKLSGKVTTDYQSTYSQDRYYGYMMPAYF